MQKSFAYLVARIVGDEESGTILKVVQDNQRDAVDNGSLGLKRLTAYVPFDLPHENGFPLNDYGTRVTVDENGNDINGQQVSTHVKLINEELQELYLSEEVNNDTVSDDAGSQEPKGDK